MVSERSEFMDPPKATAERGESRQGGTKFLGGLSFAYFSLAGKEK